MIEKETIQKIYQSLSPELLNIIASEETQAKIEKIAEKNNLTIPQMNSLSHALTMGMIGVNNLDTLFKDIEAELKVDNILSSKILTDLKAEVLSQIPSELLTEQRNKAQKIISGGSTTSSPNNLPAIEPGEVAHVVPHEESNGPILKPEEERKPVDVPKKEINLINKTPNSTSPVPTGNPYKGGADPYREPIN